MSCLDPIICSVAKTWISRASCDANEKEGIMLGTIARMGHNVLLFAMAIVTVALILKSI